jgi:NADPH:quinone reductase-like Zn-dependent oxidoreductase
MKAVVITTPGGPEVLQLQEVEDPQINEDEVLIKVEATALNRADTLQRQGKYPPPKGASPYPGLECSGTIEAVGKNVSRWKIGDQVIHFRFPQERNSLKWCFLLVFDSGLDFDFEKLCFFI